MFRRRCRMNRGTLTAIIASTMQSVEYRKNIICWHKLDDDGHTKGFRAGSDNIGRMKNSTIGDKI